MEKELLLKGVRVLCLEQAMVLPYGSAFLADWGAEVIRVESPDHIGIERSGGGWPDNQPLEDWWNGTGGYAEWNRGKKSVVINVYEPEGKQLFLELVKKSDIVADNFRPPTLEKLGLDHDSLVKVKQNIITMTLNAEGSTGPYKFMGARARTADSMSGLSYIAGYDNDIPLRVSGNYMDHIGGLTAGFLLLAAIHYMRQTGKGLRLDASMNESGTVCIAPSLLAAQYGIEYPRSGSGHPWGKAPYNVYPAKGEDQWVAITVSNDTEWAALKEAMGNPDWAHAKTFDTTIGRWDNRKELDSKLATWTGTLEKREIQAILQEQNVPAAHLLNVKDTFEDPHYEEREFFESLPPELAKTPSQSRYVGRKFTGHPWKLPETPHQFGAAPDFGQHNEEILQGLLGLSTEEVAKLKEDGVVWDTPTPREIELRKPGRNA